MTADPELRVPDSGEAVMLILLESLAARPSRMDAPVVAWSDELRTVPKTQRIRDAIDRLAASTNARARGIAMAARVSDGDADALRSLASRSELGSPEVLEALRYRFQSDQTEAVGALASLTVDRDVGMEIRRSAAAALARSTTPAALRALARLLDEEDVYLRAASVGGISRFANDISPETRQPRPGNWPYRTAETMAHATTWWSDHWAEVGSR